MLAIKLFLLSLVAFVYAFPISTSSSEVAESSATVTPSVNWSTTGNQTAVTSAISSPSSTSTVASLQALYDGNQEFRSKVRLSAEREAQQDSSFMFLGCVDNRLSPHTIFDTPAGSIISHNNVANRYDDDDSSAESAISYGIQMANVDHIIVLGHYGCKGVETAITYADTASDLVKSWVKPVRKLYQDSKRKEITELRDSRMPQRGHPNGIIDAPPTNDPGFRALVEENVKKSVKELKSHSVLAMAYSRKKKDQKIRADVFVHGFVYDEFTGEVHDLHVSFGPPGKPIPHIPFQALPAAKNFHRDPNRPGIDKGKSWDFSAHAHDHDH